MWRERLKGLVVLAILLIGGLVVVQYFSANRGKFNLGAMSFNPAAIQDKVLGVFSGLVGSTSDEELRDEFAAPVKDVERKANELIEEIKNLPQEQADVVKRQLLRTVCEPETATEEARAEEEAEE